MKKRNILKYFGNEGNSEIASLERSNMKRLLKYWGLEGGTFLVLGSFTSSLGSCNFPVSSHVSHEKRAIFSSLFHPTATPLPKRLIA